MSVLHAIVTAFACFSIIPMPRIDWNERSMRYMMAAFPLVGAIIGVLVWLWGQLCAALGFGPALRGAGLTLIPLLISGGIHLDGFADVMDAQSSHASPERRREILKDPHVGAFAVMGMCGYLLAYFALACEVEPTQLISVACIPVISRCLSGFATVTLRRASSTGMLAAEGSAAHTRVVQLALALMLAVVLALPCRLSVPVGLAMLVVAVVVLAWVRRLAYRFYGGMSGDLAGFFLQLAELAMLACVVVVGRLV